MQQVLFPFLLYKRNPVAHVQLLKEEELCLIQFPSLLPIIGTEERADKKEPKKVVDPSKAEDWAADFESTLSSIPDGHLGKLLVYRSGKMVLKIGQFEYEVWLDHWVYLICVS